MTLYYYLPLTTTYYLVSRSSSSTGQCVLRACLPVTYLPHDPAFDPLHVDDCTFHHLPSPSTTFHYLPSPFHPLPLPSITFHPLPSPSITFHYLPSPSIRCILAPTNSRIHNRPMTALGSKGCRCRPMPPTLSSMRLPTPATGTSALLATLSECFRRHYFAPS